MPADIATSVLLAEISAIQHLRQVVVTAEFGRLVERISELQGKLVVTGVGKSAIAARKIAATFATVGVQAMFLDPIGLYHGELGLLRDGDLALMISHSGETEELLRLRGPIMARGCGLASIVGKSGSSLSLLYEGLATDAIDPEFKVPTASSAAAVALGDALALSVAELRGFRDQDLALTHPGGTIGKELAAR